MVTLNETEIEKGLRMIDDVESFLLQYPNTRIRNFIRGTLREYRFHLYFNKMGVYATDLDFMIQDKNNSICCIVEVKDERSGGLHDRQAGIYLQVAEALGVPFYYVEYLEDLSGFRLYRYNRMSVTRVTRKQIRDTLMSGEQLREFFQALAEGESPRDVELIDITLEELI